MPESAWAVPRSGVCESFWAWDTAKTGNGCFNIITVVMILLISIESLD